MHYVYHPNESAKVVESTEYYKLLEEGWYDSPAKFPVVTTGLAAPVVPKAEEKEVEIRKKPGRPPRVQA